MKQSEENLQVDIEVLNGQYSWILVKLWLLFLLQIAEENTTTVDNFGIFSQNTFIWCLLSDKFLKQEVIRNQ